MKRNAKTFAVLVVLLVLAAASAAAKGSGGLRLGIAAGYPNAVIVVRPSPLDFKIGYNFADGANIFLSGDYRIINERELVDFLKFFLGVGAYAQLNFDPTDFDFGARIPIGLQAFLLDGVLELFLEVAPTIGFLPAFTAFQNWQAYFGFTVLIPR